MMNRSSRRCSRVIRLASLVLACVALQSSFASAATQTRVVRSSSYDYELSENNQTVNGSSFGIIGGASGTGQGRNAMLAFQMPQLDAQEAIQSATLTVHLLTTFGTPLTFNTDVYILNISPSPTVIPEGFNAGPTSTTGYRIVDNFFTPQTSLGAIAATVTADVKQVYSPGDYLLLRLSPDAALSVDSAGYQIAMSEDAAKAPTLTLVTTIAPEPATLAAAAIGGALLRRRRRI